MSTIDRDPFAYSPVFGVLDEADRARLTERSRRVEVDKGQVVICEGDASDSVLVLLSGQMKAVTYSQEGDEFILNTVVPGDTIGEIGVLSGGPRTATVQATAPSTVLTLSRSALVQIIEERPALAVVLLEYLSHTVSRLTGVASDLVHLDLATGGQVPAAEDQRPCRRNHPRGHPDRARRERRGEPTTGQQLLAGVPEKRMDRHRVAALDGPGSRRAGGRGRDLRLVRRSPRAGASGGH